MSTEFELAFHMCRLHNKQVVRGEHGAWKHVRNNGSLGAECMEGERQTITLVEELLWEES